jgi:hypothetical protein
MGVPVLFGYLMPWIAMGVVKRWRFTGGPRVGSYYVHHGIQVFELDFGRGHKVVTHVFWADPSGDAR